MFRFRDIPDGGAAMNAATRPLTVLLLMLYITLPSLAPSQTVNFTSSNLPIVFIDTHGQEIPDEPKITADMGIVDNGPGQRNAVTDSFNVYNGKIGIEVRGFSSQQFPKLQYGVETRDTSGNDLAVSLLGMPADADWVLSAGYNDKTLLRNALAYYLANSAGRYASRSRFCEVVLNGDYIGVYVLFEKIKRDKNRVDVTKMKTTDTTGNNLTGGYIISLDRANNVGDEWWTSPFPPFPGTDQVINYLYIYPKPEDLVPAQRSYIKDYVTAFETVMNDSGFADTTTGYARYLDRGSAVDFFLINELSRNVDAYRLSSYMYKDRDSKGGKLKIGPVWDFDIAFGNVYYAEGPDTVGWDLITMPQILPTMVEDQIPFWWVRLSEDSTFWHAAGDRWAGLRDTQFTTERVYAFIDSLVVYLDEAQQRNFERWPILSEYVWPNAYVGGSYANEIAYLKNWVSKRMVWMDRAFAPAPTEPNTTVSVAAGSGWQIVSVPLQCSDMHMTSVFPSAAGSIFGYENGYVADTVLTGGKGYWVKHAMDTSYAINGVAFNQSSIALRSGWNLIGIFDDPITVSQLGTVPSDILTTYFYGYSNGYDIASTLEVGKGYWVKANQLGVLTIPAGPAKARLAETATIGVPNEDWGAIILRDNQGHVRRLYKSKANLDVTRYELPPSVPQESLDVGWSCHTLVEGAGPKELIFHCADYPIVIRIERMNARIHGNAGGTIIDREVHDGDTIVIHDRVLGSLIVEDVETPVTYGLSQNYPNPFNPTTTIKFALPYPSDVSIELYNVLGQKVATVVNSAMEAGFQSQTYDATGLASGVYFCVMDAWSKTTAQRFREIRKMMVLR
jgi:hypothetical protein